MLLLPLFLWDVQHVLEKHDAVRKSTGIDVG